jgi:hypothetical protein
MCSRHFMVERENWYHAPPMGLATRLVSYVSPKVRRRGGSYFHDQRVTLGGCGPDTAVAWVRGSRPYEVRLARSGERLEASCSCPFFVDRGEVCKHVWAALLAADARSALRGARGDLPKVLAAASNGQARASSNRGVRDSGPPGHEPPSRPPSPPARRRSSSPKPCLARRNGAVWWTPS